MSVPPSKLRAKLKAMSASRDATKGADAPSDDLANAVEAKQRAGMQPDSFDRRYGKRPPLTTQLQDDIDTANRNLTGNSRKKK